MLTPLAIVYCDEGDIRALLSVLGVQARVDDDNTGVVTTEQEGFVTKAISWASARCNQYLLTLHKAADLAQSYIVNWWCTILAAENLCARSGNPVPESLTKKAEDVLKEMTVVQAANRPLADTATRDAMFFTWSNMTFIDGYGTRKIFVQKSISDRSAPKGRQQARDWTDTGFWTP